MDFQAFYTVDPVATQKMLVEYVKIIFEDNHEYCTLEAVSRIAKLYDFFESPVYRKMVSGLTKSDITDVIENAMELEPREHIRVLLERLVHRSTF